MSRITASEALKRFTVLDLTRARAGPTAARMLADWGADVIKIEAPLHRGGRDPLADDRRDPDYTNLHRNKRSIVLDLKHPDGVAVFKSLATKADVVLENYRPAVKDRLGIAYEDLKPLNPRLVYGSISGFGQDGPYRDRPGVDQIAQGMGGLMSITGLPGQGPVRVGIPISDLCAGIMLAYGVLTALLEREVSGEGQWVSTSLLEAMIHMLDFQAARWLIDQDVPGQAGNDHPTAAPMGVYRAADGYLNIGVAGKEMWRKFCAAIDAPDMPEDTRYAVGRDRWKNRDALRADINAKLATNTVNHWVEVLNAAGIPCGPINTVDHALENPQVKHLGIAQETVIGEKLTLLGQAIHMSRTPSQVQSVPHRHGADTDAVLKDYGYAEDTIADLRAKDVI